jgi:hypothetical protein
MNKASGYRFQAAEDRIRTESAATHREADKLKC